MAAAAAAAEAEAAADAAAAEAAEAAEAVAAAEATAEAAAHAGDGSDNWFYMDPSGAEQVRSLPQPGLCARRLFRCSCPYSHHAILVWKWAVRLRKGSCAAGALRHRGHARLGRRRRLPPVAPGLPMPHVSTQGSE